MLTHYENEWMAKERMREIERWIHRKTLDNQCRAPKRSVPILRLILTWWCRKSI